jgi:small subunit ribosomal protein S16
VVKIRLKRLGYKKNPSYRIVVIYSRSKREGAPIEELGYYNPKTKEMKLNVERAKSRLSQGAQASETVMYLINNANADGTLNYKKTETPRRT